MAFYFYFELVVAAVCCFNWVVDMLVYKVRACVYIANPIRRTAESALHFTDLFVPTPAQLIWVSFSGASITARRLFDHLSPPLSAVRCSFIQSELRRRGEDENV